MVVALAHVMMPFMVLSVWAALQRLDPQIENAALSLGAGPLTIIRRIVLPQIMPGVLSGAIIVFSLSASAFATPAIIGGRRLKVAATLAYDEFLNTLNWPLGAAVAVAAAGGAGADRRRQQRADRAPLCRGVPMRTERPARADLPRDLRRRHAGADRGGLPRRFHARGLFCRCRPTASRCAGSGRSRTIPSSSMPSGSVLASARCPPSWRCCSRCRQRSRLRAIVSAAAMRSRRCSCRR